jgi:3-hydroxyacyl-[acyl-carrier-protein] dehydratase
VFGGVDRLRFRRPVRPGDQLTLEFVLERLRGPVGVGKVRALVGDEVAADGTISFALVDL